MVFTWFWIEKFLPLDNNNNKKQPAFQLVFLIIFPESDGKTVSRRRLKPFSSVALYPRLLYFVTEDVSPAVFSKSSLSLSGAGSTRQFNTEQLSAFCERVGGGSLSSRRGTHTVMQRHVNLILSALALRMVVKLTFSVLSSLIWFLAVTVSESRAWWFWWNLSEAF